MASRKSDRTTAPRPKAEGFWDRPGQIHLVADFLSFIAIVALGYAGVAAALTMPVFPLKELTVVSPLKQVTTAQLEYAAKNSLAGNFFTVDLDKVRQAFEKLPWVRRVAVRRVWPDSIELQLEEHVAEAIWKQGETEETRLVNSQGEVFAAASHAPLPVLAGPTGRAPDVLARYRELLPALAPLGRTLQGLTLSSREAWQLRLDDGLVVELGREQLNAPLKQRLARFVDSYGETVARAGAPLVMADLRYPNGFALRLGRSGVPATKGKE